MKRDPKILLTALIPAATLAAASRAAVIEPGGLVDVSFTSLAFLVSALPASAQTNVLITEFMASNTSTLADEDGDASPERRSGARAGARGPRR